MKIVFIIIFSILFLKADDKVVLDSTLLPPLNYEIFEAKLKSENLLKKKKVLDVNMMIALLTEESTLVKTIKKNSK